jgi:hypothetical protein
LFVAGVVAEQGQTETAATGLLLLLLVVVVALMVAAMPLVLV